MIFWIDRQRNINISLDKFVEDINLQKNVPLYIKTSDPYEMLLLLVSGMVHGKEMYLLDSDFTHQEMVAMGISNADLTRVSDINDDTIVFKDTLVNQVINSNWKLWLFTSGTTGLPKKVCHSYATLGRNVRQSDNHKSDVWALAYRMSHMAGIQVILQALVNVNTMVYVFEQTPQEIIKDIITYACTHISATPTFYRNILPFMSDEMYQLKHLTLGGEKYDEMLCEKIQEMLPNVRIHNIYASTETGSLLNAKDNCFSIPERYKEQIKISETGELLIHKSLLGDFSVEGEWYNTHDLVNVENNMLYFVSRQSDLINIGGYKVNPLEVEETISEISGVVDCAVKGQNNSVLGKLLVADVIKIDEYEEKELKKRIIKYLREKLQPFKIPRIINFVEEINHTRSGKKVR